MNVFAQQIKPFSTVSFKVNHREAKEGSEAHAELLEEKVWHNDNPEIFIPGQNVKTPNPTWKAFKYRIDYSSHKLALCAWTIRKMHLFDAIETVASIDKKGGPIVKSVLEAARHNGARQGMDEQRMFVKSVVVGRAQGFKKIDIKARGKMGFTRAPVTSLTLELEEKGPEDMYKLVMQGKAPAGVGTMFRTILY